MLRTSEEYWDRLQFVIPASSSGRVSEPGAEKTAPARTLSGALLRPTCAVRIFGRTVAGGTPCNVGRAMWSTSLCDMALEYRRTGPGRRIRDMRRHGVIFMPNRRDFFRPG